MRQIWPIDAAAYCRHPVHRGERSWLETNCYVDLWIELLHTAGLEPLAMLPFTLAIDIEGDQWTFLKCPFADLQAIYGIDVIELNIWRPLLSHIDQQLALGRVPIVEVDAFHLPDTAGTAYRTDHVKTSIAIQSLDVDARRLGYFHNAGYYEIAGEDFTGLLGAADRQADGAPLPPYVEAAKLGVHPPKTGRALVATSIESLAYHLERVPSRNPFREFAPRFDADLSSLAKKPLADFHGYAFATFRQFGAAFELAGAYVRWLEAQGEGGLGAVATACDTIASTAWTLQLKTARFVSANRAFDPAPLVDVMADAWDETRSGLTSRYGGLVHHA